MPVIDDVLTGPMFVFERVDRECINNARL